MKWTGHLARLDAGRLMGRPGQGEEGEGRREVEGVVDREHGRVDITRVVPSPHQGRISPTGKGNGKKNT